MTDSIQFQGRAHTARSCMKKNQREVCVQSTSHSRHNNLSSIGISYPAQPERIDYFFSKTIREQPCPETHIGHCYYYLYDRAEAREQLARRADALHLVESRHFLRKRRVAHFVKQLSTQLSTPALNKRLDVQADGRTGVVRITAQFKNQPVQLTLPYPYQRDRQAITFYLQDVKVELSPTSPEYVALEDALSTYLRNRQGYTS